jgi:ABC-type nitrate/sulfonate/bicarbonate transport system substrate-binding protein
MLNRVVQSGLVAAVTAAISLGTMALGAPAMAQTTLRVGKAIGANFAFLGADVGMAAGIYQKHGLKLQIVDFHGSAKLQQGLTADAIDIGLGSGPEMAFIVKGAPNIAIAALADQPRTIMLVVRKDGPVKTMQDLKGRIISCSTAGSLTNWLGHELSKQLGWGADGIKITPLGGMAAQTAALKTKQIDGMIVESTTAFKAEEAGFGKILVRFGDRFKHFHVHVIYARKAFVEKHPELVRAFLAAWFESVNYMATHKEETIEVAKNVAHVSKSIAEKNYNELMPMFNRTGRFDPKALELLAQSYVEMHILPSKPDMSELYTEKFLPKM